MSALICSISAAIHLKNRRNDKRDPKSKRFRVACDARNKRFIVSLRTDGGAGGSGARQAHVFRQHRNQSLKQMLQKVQYEGCHSFVSRAIIKKYVRTKGSLSSPCAP
jgi:hypothetical protein